MYEPQPGEIYIYSKTLRHYEIIGTCMIKTHKPDSNDGWTPGVIYKGIAGGK